MNNTQRLVSDISGYCGLGESGARDDGYYECKTAQEKMDYLQQCVDSMEGYNKCDLNAVMHFLDREFVTNNHKYYEFKMLMCAE